MRLSAWWSVAIAILLVATPVRAAEWVEVKTAHFVIYGKRSDRGLSQLATRLEKLNTLLMQLFHRQEVAEEGVRPLLVYVVSQSEVTENARTNTAAGFYASDRRNGYAVVKRGGTDDRFDLGQEQILFHEFAHHFMLANLQGAYPAWYVEGFAEFFSTLTFKDDNSVLFGQIPMYRAPQLAMVGLYPVHKVLYESSAGLSLGDGDLYYGTAWLLTHYLFLNPARNAEFQRYLADLAAPGGAWDIVTYFQGGEAQLSRDLQAYRLSRLKGFSLSLSADIPPPAVRALGPDENALLIQELRFRRPMPAEDATALATEVKAIAARFPDSAHAQAFLAEVLSDMADWQPALAAADAAIRLDPANARAHSARAEILWGQARNADETLPVRPILQEISAANRADLEDPYPLFLYYLFKRQQGPVPDVAIDGLRKAFWQLPQYARYRWAYARAMADRHDYAEAIAVITPLANDPHGGGSAEAAQRRIEELKALRDGRAPAAPAGKSPDGDS